MLAKKTTKTIDFVENLEGLDSTRYASISWGSSSGSAIDTHITPELAAEGMAREIVRRLQNMRRSAGFDIVDHIDTYYQGDEYIREVMKNKTLTDYIKQETLSERLIEGVPEKVNYTESYKLGGYNVLLGVKRLG